MVIVSDYMEKVNATSGHTFILLELSVGLELVQQPLSRQYEEYTRKYMRRLVFI
jgi:hypothetical protein